MYRLILFIFLCLSLSACGTITRGLSELNKSGGYEAAHSDVNQLLYDPPHIKLSHYKSVQKRANQRSYFAVAIAASGGGYRASNLTAGVLMGLEKLHFPEVRQNLLQEVDYISSVSGGGFAIGLYLSSYYRHLLQTPKKRFSFSKVFLKGRSPLKANLRMDYSDDLFFGSQRSLDLEAKLSKNLLQISPNRELLLGDIFIHKDDSSKKAQLPLWVTNSAIIQNSNIFQFVPTVLQKYKISAFQHKFKKHRVRQKSKRVYAYNMPFAVGMTASAAFPYAVSGTTLWSQACDKTCYLQLFDGGLVDNLGVYSALEILRQDKARYKLLIVIDAFGESPQPFSKSRQPPKKLDLLHKVTTSSPNSFQRQMRDYIPLVAKNILCTAGTEQVLVAYLDLYHSPKARKVPTSLWMTEENQNLMLKTGMRLVRNNIVLTRDVPNMLKGIKIASCQ